MQDVRELIYHYSMSKRKLLCVALLAITTSMACAFVQNMLFPPPVPAIPSPGASGTTGLPTTMPEPMDEPEPISCSNDDCLNSCLERIENVLETRPYQALPEIYANNEANINLIQYDTNGDTLLKRRELWVPSDFRIYQQEKAAEESIWHFYTNVIPIQFRSDVRQLMIFTDGESNVLAWVDQDLDHPDAWTVGFDLIDARNPLYLTESLIHETGHLITLNTDQVTFGYFSGTQGQAQCPQFVLESGCSQPFSYINLFYQKFWVSLFDEWWEEVVQSDRTDEPDEIVYDFYLDHSDEFITDYAATNIEEDMADSFEYFVLSPKYVGDSIADQKVSFFYDFPELVDARRQIIQGLCAYLPN